MARLKVDADDCIIKAIDCQKMAKNGSKTDIGIEWETKTGRDWYFWIAIETIRRDGETGLMVLYKSLKRRIEKAESAASSSERIRHQPLL